MLLIQYVTLCPHSRYPRVVQSASWPVHELTSPRDVHSASWRIRELSSNRCERHRRKTRKWRYNENDITMPIAGLWRYGDCRHVAMDCTALENSRIWILAWKNLHWQLFTYQDKSCLGTTKGLIWPSVTSTETWASFAAVSTLPRTSAWRRTHTTTIVIAVILSYTQHK